MTNKIKPIFHIKHPVGYNRHNPPGFLKHPVVHSPKVPRPTKPHGQCSHIRSWLLRNLRNFCNTTSLHGFNYIGREDFTPKERFFWIVIVIIAINISILLVTVSYLWNRETPTVTVIESSHFPTWNIPFPAVTLCNFNKISKTKSLLLAKQLKRPENTSIEEVQKSFQTIMYYSFAFNESDVNMPLIHNILKLNNLTVASLADQITPNCLDTISKCMWKGMVSRCDSLFQRIKSMAFGECCTFNYFGEEKNNFPEKIVYQVPKRPYRVTGCGYPTGLTILVNPFAYDYYASSFSSYGFRLLIHDSYNAPDENAESKIISSNHESFVHVNPESTYATKDVSNMDMKIRNCLFPHEQKLHVMQHYSFVNCMWECRMTYIFRQCGCIPHNLPNNGTFRKCDLKDINCVVKNKDIFSSALSDYNSTLPTLDSISHFPCNCLPDCQLNRYKSEITMGRLNINLTFQKENLEQLPNNTNNILLHIFFSDLMSTRYRKDIYQNWLSALASFGGLLGLIMGFSIVTAFEFVYFLTFRPVFNYYNDQ